MKEAADWQIEHLHDDHDRERPRNNNLWSWPFASLYVGMVKWAAIADDEYYFEFLKSIRSFTARARFLPPARRYAD